MSTFKDDKRKALQARGIIGQQLIAAYNVIGWNRAKWELQNMVHALTITSRLNDADDNERLEAAQLILMFD